MALKRPQLTSFLAQYPSVVWERETQLRRWLSVSAGRSEVGGAHVWILAQLLTSVPSRCQFSSYNKGFLGRLNNVLSLKHIVEDLSQGRSLKIIFLWSVFPFLSLPIYGRWLVILNPSALSMYHLLCNFGVPPARGRKYFSTPVLLGSATWFDLGLAMWFALAIGILADRTLLEAWNVFLWLSLFMRTPTFCHEKTCLKKPGSKEDERRLEEPWTWPAAWRQVQLSPAWISWSPAEL